MAIDIKAGIGLDGEKEFKQAVSGINKDLSVLSSEMKKVTAQFDGNASSMEALTAAQKVYNDRAEEQRRKIEVLTAALENAKTEFGENSDKVKDWQIKLNNAEADLAKTENALKQTTDQIEIFGKEADDSGDEVKTLGNNLDDAGQKTITFGDLLKANILGQAIVDGVRALGDAIKDLATNALENADGIKQMSDQTGLSSEKIQELTYVGNTLGVSIDTMTGSYSKMINNMSSASTGTGEASKAFEKLGVSVTDNNGNLRDAEQVWQETISALGNVTNETEATAIAQDIFGRSASDLNPLIKATAEELKDLSDEAHSSGAVMSGDTVDALDNFGDTMGQVKDAIQGAAGTMFAELIPSLQPFMEKLKSIDFTPIKNGLQFIIDNAEVITAGLAAIGTGLLVFEISKTVMGLVSAFKAFKAAQEGVTIAQAALNAVMAANPIGIIIAVVAALVAGFLVLWNTSEGFRKAVKEIWTDIKNAFVSAWGTIKGVWETAAGFFTEVWNGIVSAFSAVGTFFKETFTEAWNKAKEVFSGAMQWGKDIINNIWAGLKSAWEDVTSWFTGVWDSLFGNRTADVTVNTHENRFVTYTERGGTQPINGSYASGLSYVPFDGFIAELHKGEAVIPAGLMAGLRTLDVVDSRATQPERDVSALVNGMAAVLGNQGGNYTINLVLDGRTAASVLFDPLRNVAKQKGVAFA